MTHVDIGAEYPIQVRVIKLVDHRGRTLCKFIKPPGLPWVQAISPHPAFAQDGPPYQWGLVRLADGRLILQAPGLTLHWEKVTPVLDRLAETSRTRLTVRELRDSARS
jgi:hypothetical protein